MQLLPFACIYIANFAILAQLEAMRAARVKQEEELALMQAQSSVQTLQQLDKMKKQQEKMVRLTMHCITLWFSAYNKLLLYPRSQKLLKQPV